MTDDLREARQQRQWEDKCAADLVMQKAEVMLAAQGEAISIKIRTKTQQDECLAAERAIASMRRGK